MKNSKRIRRADRRKYHYIYETICLITNKFYIGMHSTDNLQDGYCGSGKYLWNSLNKYGKDKHVTKILEFLPDRKSLKAREKEIINEELLDNQHCMNLAIGGEGGLVNEKHSKILSKAGNEKIAWLRKNNPEWARQESSRRTESNIKLHREGRLTNPTFQGRSHTKSTKNKISKASSAHQKGIGNSQHGTCWVYNLELQRSKKIKKEELNTFLSQGWIKGRKITF